MRQVICADGMFTLKFHPETNAVEFSDNESETNFNVQLESEEEFNKLVLELNDPEGDLPSKPDSICNKYEALKAYIP